MAWPVLTPVPFSLRLPPGLRLAGWKVKIRDRERLEPPHVMILFRTRAWRLDLRTGRFLDSDASWRDLDPRLRPLIEDRWCRLCDEWDARYPGNPVGDSE